MSTLPFYPSQDLVAAAPLITAADDTAFTVAGTVTFHLYALTGDNAGKWWDADNEEWSASEVSAGSGTHVAQGIWTTTIDELAFEHYTRYALYAKEASSLIKPWSVELVPMATAYDGTVETVAAPGVIDVCNMSIGILSGAVNASYPFLDSWDEDTASQESLTTLRWYKIFYPRARNKMQCMWDWPEGMAFAKMGASLSSGSANLVPGWTYNYSKPDGCLSFRAIVGNTIDAATGRWKEYPFLEIGNQIACNINNDDDDPQYLFRYNQLVQNPTNWSEGLLQSTAHLLAFYASRATGGTLENQALVKKLFDDAFTSARAECQSRLFVPDFKAQEGDAVEMAPGLLDWNFPKPE